MTIAQIVHSEIDNSVESLLRKIKTNSIEDYIQGFTKDEFKGLLGEYRLKYPQNPFITEEQVKQICIEYDLKLGSELAFIGEIPEKNLKEINSFKSPKEKVFVVDLSKTNIRSIHRYLRDSFKGTSSINFSPEEDTIEMVGALEGFSPEKFILPISKNLAIHFDSSKMTAVETGCGDFVIEEIVGGVSVVCQDENYNVISVEIDRNLVMLEQFATVRSRGGMFGSEDFGRNIVNINLRVNLRISKILRILNNAIENKSYRIERKVIAPGKLFNTTALKEIDDYRYVLDELAMTKSTTFVDDPIILHPVKGGYLVVTKWGGESKLIETNSN